MLNCNNNRFEGKTKKIYHCMKQWAIEIKYSIKYEFGYQLLTIKSSVDFVLPREYQLDIYDASFTIDFSNLSSSNQKTFAEKLLLSTSNQPIIFVFEMFSILSSEEVQMWVRCPFESVLFLSFLSYVTKVFNLKYIQVGDKCTVLFALICFLCNQTV